jgi:hypothetical protein
MQLGIDQFHIGLSAKWTVKVTTPDYVTEKLKLEVTKAEADLKEYIRLRIEEGRNLESVIEDKFKDIFKDSIFQIQDGKINFDIDNLKDDIGYRELSTDSKFLEINENYKIGFKAKEYADTLDLVEVDGEYIIQDNQDRISLDFPKLKTALNIPKSADLISATDKYILFQSGRISLKMEILQVDILQIDDPFLKKNRDGSLSLEFQKLKNEIVKDLVSDDVIIMRNGLISIDYFKLKERLLEGNIFSENGKNCELERSPKNAYNFIKKDTKTLRENQVELTFEPNGDIISVLIKKQNSLYWEERDDEIVEGNILWFENGTKDDSYLNALVRVLYLY